MPERPMNTDAPTADDNKHCDVYSHADVKQNP